MGSDGVWPESLLNCPAVLQRQTSWDLSKWLLLLEPQLSHLSNGLWDCIEG